MIISLIDGAHVKSQAKKVCSSQHYKRIYQIKKSPNILKREHYKKFFPREKTTLNNKMKTKIKHLYQKYMFVTLNTRFKNNQTNINKIMFGLFSFFKLFLQEHIKS